MLQHSTLKCSSRLYIPFRRVRNNASSVQPVINIPRSSIYELGQQHPTLRDLSFTVKRTDSWAIVSKDAATVKTALIGALTGTHRLEPHPPEGIPAFEQVRVVRFAHRGKASGDGFYDFTARYGAVREEDRRTLRDTFFPEFAKPLHALAMPDLVEAEMAQRAAEVDQIERERKRVRFEFLADRLRLVDLLDLPMVALSNGQTRRARIAKALLEDPKLLILDEPLTGLDAKSRDILFALLSELKQQPDSPHVLLTLRPQDPIPDFTTHLAVLEGNGDVQICEKDSTSQVPLATSPATPQIHAKRSHGKTLIELDGVTVAYGPRRVLSEVRWEIRANARWHLIGENGAGKTTLLALLTGEHPLSYAQSDALRLFGAPRARWPTPLLHRRIGRVSPELFNAFPRRHDLTVWHAVGTGFDGGFVPKGRRHLGLNSDGLELEAGGKEEAWRLQRMREIMRALGPSRWREGADEQADEAFWKRAFVDLTPGEQSMVLLMRALVGQPPLVLLDEAWAGMDSAMVQAAHEYLRDGGGGLSDEQACVVISHWEDEVPWGAAHGVERFKLDGGLGTVITA